MPVTDEDGYVWITVDDYDRAIEEGRAKQVPKGWGVISGFYWVPEFTPGILRGTKIVINEEG